MTPDLALAILALVFLVAIVAGLVVFVRLTNSKGGITWDVTTTIPDDPWALKFTAAERDEAMGEYARKRFDSPLPGPEPGDG